MDAIDIDGLRVGYQRVGVGPAVVLLHGYVGDGPATWRPQIDHFADDFTVVAWDAPGAGSSADPPETFGMAGYADCLAAFITALDLAPAHLVGLSFGGALALEITHRHPFLIQSLIVVSGYAGWGGSLTPEVAAQRLSQALTLSTVTPSEFVETLLPTMFAITPPAEDADAFSSSVHQFHPSGFRAMARASAEDLRPGLVSITVPTLLVYGDEDVRAPPRPVAEQLNRAIASSSLVMLRGVGHLCNLEDAAAFNAAVHTWLCNHS
jgi:pimeloyl-ACP methyl ester carboxylesterase